MLRTVAATMRRQAKFGWIDDGCDGGCDDGWIDGCDEVWCVWKGEGMLEKE